MKNNGGDGSSSTSLESVEETLDGSASAGDGTASDGTASSGGDGSSATTPFGEPEEDKTGRGSAGPTKFDYAKDILSLGYAVVENKDDSKLPDRMLVTYDQTNNWFDESFFGRPTRDSSPGIIGKAVSVVAHFPYFGNEDPKTSSRAVKQVKKTPTPDGGDESRGTEVTRRGVLHGLGLGAAGTYGAADLLGGDDRRGVPPTNDTETPYETETDTETVTVTPTDTPTETPTYTVTPTPTPESVRRTELPDWAWKPVDDEQEGEAITVDEDALMQTSIWWDYQNEAEYENLKNAAETNDSDVDWYLQEDGDVWGIVHDANFARQFRSEEFPDEESYSGNHPLEEVYQDLT